MFCFANRHTYPEANYSAGDEVLEWNGHPLTNKSYEDVHDIISGSRHDLQVELRVSRLLSTPVAAATAATAAARTPGVGVGVGAARLGPAAASTAAAATATPGGGRTALGPSSGTRIQVGPPKKRNPYSPNLPPRQNRTPFFPSRIM